MTPVLSVSQETSAETIADLVRILFRDARTALDTTYGSGKFWTGDHTLKVTGLDQNPERAKHVCGDFTKLPFADDSFDLVVFDPPYHTDMGRGKPSVMGDRFGTYATIPELQTAVRAGCKEAWRVARLGVIVKCQDYIHAQRAVWMSLWVWAAFPVQPYDAKHVYRSQKMLDPKWTRQLSVWRNHTTYWVYRTDGPIHKARA